MCLNLCIGLLLGTEFTSKLEKREYRIHINFKWPDRSLNWKGEHLVCMLNLIRVKLLSLFDGGLSQQWQKISFFHVTALIAAGLSVAFSEAHYK